MISCQSVLNRVYNFTRVCTSYKQGIACPKQGIKIELVVLNRVCILGIFFVLNRVRVSNPQRLTYTQIWVEYLPRELHLKIKLWNLRSGNSSFKLELQLELAKLAQATPLSVPTAASDDISSLFLAKRGL